MADAREHLLSALESVLRAAAEGVATFRDGSGESSGWGARWARELGGWIERVEGPSLDALRDALGREATRWEERAERDSDPAAARVAEIFRAAREVLESDPPAARAPAGARPRPRSDRKPAPRRAKGV